MITTFLQLNIVLASMQVSELADISNPVRICFFKQTYSIITNRISQKQQRNSSLTRQPKRKEW